VRFQTASYDVAQALVGTGIGVALVSKLALSATPGTVHRELAEQGLHRRLYAATSPTPRSPRWSARFSPCCTTSPPTSPRGLESPPIYWVSYPAW